MKYPTLNLPEYQPSLRKEEGTEYIWDPIRKNWLVCTPEEWVRQHFIYLLTHYLKYPKGLIRVETGLDYYQRKKRSDIEVLNRDGTCFMLVECKAGNQKIDQKALNQISLYNKTVKADHIVLTNGNETFIWYFDAQAEKYQVLASFPEFPR